MTHDTGPSPIAIVGMACRFPGAPTIERFWENLRAGVESVSFFSDAELLASGVDPALLQRPDYVRAGAVIDDIDLFAASFFGFSPREADVMNPQQRIFLECAWEAIERAGYDPARYSGRIGVFAGSGMNAYLLRNVYGNPDVVRAVDPYTITTGNDKDFVPTRVSYLLDLRGPSVAVNTACSTSLVAVHMACVSLWSYESDMALAGGVTLQVPQRDGYVYVPGGIRSSDGHCRAFDAKAQGTVNGNGAGLVLLKRLEDAQADGDHIHAVIRGSAINNDGSGKVGFMAPGVDGQADAIASAHGLAGVDPATISYVEAHGTGTALGDPIEITALTQAFSRGSRRSRSCAIGTVKSNIGHLDTAAGVAGLIKTVLALEHREIPPSLHFESPSPRIDFAAGPFHVNARLTAWEAGEQPRRAGVSSFGIGGTNAHVLLEEAPSPSASAPRGGPVLLPVSAKTDTALASASLRLADYLEAHPDAALDDVAFTLQSGRRAFEHRGFVVATSAAEAAAALRRAIPASATRARESSRVIFMYPGQGSQYPGMAAALYDSEPVFREHVDRGIAALDPALGSELKHLLLSRDADGERLRQTMIAQPALFLVEYAATQLWLSWGVRPAALIGHSLGEYVAACIAGVFSFEDALRLVIERGRLMQSMPPGKMLAVAMPDAELTPLLGEGLAIAAINAPGRCVVSGSADAIAALEVRLEQAGVVSQALETSHAFHSAMMDPAARVFAGVVAACTLHAPEMTVFSSATGRVLTADEATDPAYWAAQLRRTVRFADGVTELLGDTPAIFLEIGPGRALGAFVQGHPLRQASRHTVLQTMGHPRQDAGEDVQRLTALGRVWASGADVDWSALQRGGHPRRVILPTYPFERTRHWIDAPRALPAAPAALRRSASRAASPRDWLSAPAWRRAPLPIPPSAALAPGTRFLVLAPGSGPLAAPLDGLCDQLRARGAAVSIVRRRDVDAADRDAYSTLLAPIADGEGLPHAIVHGWSGDEGGEAGNFYSLIFLAHALSSIDAQWACRVTVLTHGQHRVTGSEPLVPMSALTRGPVHVLPQEYPQLAFRGIDLDPAGTDAGRLLAEIVRDASERDVAIRGRYRWTASLEPLDPPPAAAPLLRKQGVYWITGGFGGVGLHLAEHLASRYAAKLVLTGRHPFDRQAIDLGHEAEQIGRDLHAHGTALAIRRIDEYDGLTQAFDRLCTAHIVRTLQRAGVELRAGRHTTRSALRDALALLPAFERFLDFFVDTLAADGIVRRDGEVLEVLADGAEAGDPDALGAALAAAQPGFRALIEFLAHCADRYGDALSGRMPAIEVLYPGGSSALMQRVAAETVEHDDYRVFLRTVRDLIARLARASSRKVRVLEIGGGKGLLTGEVVPALTGLDVEYHFTDLGASFVADMAGEVERRGLDFVHCSRLDISRDPAAQGYVPGSFDIVIGADVVHATRDVEVTLAHLRTLLRPGGVLAIVEGARSRRWKEMIWGLAEGWWLFEDVHVRGRGTPLVAHASWEGCLTRQGFADVHAFPTEDGERRDADFSVVIGQKPGAEPTELAERIRALEAAGADVLPLAADVADPQAMALARDAALARFGRIDGVIHAAGVDDRQLAGSYDRAGAAAGLRPKVDGTLVLRDALAGTDVGVLVLCSSLSAVSPGIGDTTYCSANAFLDAYAQSAAGGARRVVSINWDRWRGVGQARPFERRHEKRTGKALPGGMDAADAVAAFEELLRYEELSQVVVSPLDFTGSDAVAAPAEPAAAEVQRAAAAVTASSGTLHPRPELSTPYVPPRTDLERALAAIFEDVLGINGLGIHDDFNELGGDSLMAVRVVSRVRDRLARELDVRALFDAPTIAGLASRLDAAHARLAPLVSGPRDADAPLSLAQQRLWFLHCLEGPSATYNILAARRLQGPLDRAALQVSVDALVARHEALRTTFYERDGVGYQRVHEPSSVRIAEVSLAHLGAGRRETELARVRDEQAARAFDLERGPLLAITLVELAPDDHVLLMVMHHIISDGWSLGVLSDEMARLYAAARAGRDAAMPALPIQYRDFAWWQRTSLDEAALEAKIARWRERLAAAAPLLELHPGRTRPGTRSTDGRTLPLRLPPSVSARLKALARECDASLFMVLLAGFDVLLQRYSGRDDLLVGTQVANRDRRELEGLVGFFINTVVVRTSLGGRPTFRQLVARVRESALGAFAMQDTPFERLVDALQPERSFSYNPIVQVMFLWQNAPMGALDLAGLTITPLPMPSRASKFDLTLELVESERGIEGGLEYSTDLFAAPEIEQMAALLSRLLDAAAASPDVPVADLALAAAEESSDLVAPDAAAPVAAATLVEAFAAVVANHADATAIVHRSESVSYAALDRRANQLARRLVEAGVRPEDRVGIFMPRSIEAIVSMLAVLKAGGAYVPLDPAHPAERVAAMLRVSGATVVCTMEQWATLLPPSTAGVVLDRDAAAIAAYPGSAPGGRVQPRNLAYVLFTSGSTGVPKGVQIEHADVLTLVSGLHEAFLAGESGQQRIALMAALVFDASVQQIFMSLCFGHTLCLTDEHTRLDATALREYFREQSIQISDGTPSLLAILLDAGVPADASLPVRRLLIGGEALPFDRVRALQTQDRGGRIALTNIYGPAECCVDVCAWTVTAGEAFEAGSVPIGTPLAGRRLMVVDTGGRPQPRGLTGEIFIAGAGVGRGYIGDPAGTARRFLPFAGGAGQRGYATGDRGRIDGAGRLQFLGRSDGQVKVRGYRIELGEIEVQLRAQPGVRRAAVAARPVSTGHMELVAYVVAAPGAELTAAALRDGLAAHLPAYMIPSRFVRLDELPVNSSGKLDRASLPAPDAATTLHGGSAHAEPRTEKERAVADVWRDVLALERVGLDDNYFASGGDSIKALQIVARLRARGLALQIKHFFTHPTVRELAPLVGAVSGAAPAAGMTAGAIPLTPIQRRFFTDHAGDYRHFAMPVLLAPAANIDRDALRRALDTVGARHEALRLRFRRAGGQWIQEYVPDATAASFEIVDLRDGGDPERALEAHAATIQSTFDLAAGPLLKAVLYQRAGGDRLLLAAHHLVVDGVSWRILLQDLADAYQAAVEQREAALPAPSSSFQAFVEQIQAYAGGAARDERALWSAAVAPALPEDGPGGVTRYQDLDRLTIALGAEETRRLGVAHQAYATRTPEILLAALARAARDWTGQARVAVMLEGHGRDLPGELDLSRTVGWFTSAYPVVLDVAAGDDPGRDLKQAKETLRAVPHGGIGYGALRYLGDAEAAAAPAPAPALSFNFLGEFGAAAGGAPFQHAREALGPAMDPGARPPYEIEMVGVVVDGRLELEVLYSTRRFRRETVATFVDRFRLQLQQLIQHAVSRPRPELTPSDLSYDGFDLAGLDRFFATVEQRSGGAIGRDDVVDVRRLTPLQEGLLFHALADEASAAYHQQISYRLRGELDPARFEAAWNRLFERHEVLRTAIIHDAADHPVQVVLHGRRIELAHEDLRPLSPQEQEQRVQAWRGMDRRRGFDLARDVLMRAAVLRLADDCHEIVWSHHHILLDGWSLGILQRELQALAADPQRQDLPPAPRFADYIRWLGARDGTASERFWAGELAGYDRVAELPRTALASPPATRRRHAFTLPPETADGLRRLASARGATLNSVVHALWGILLARYGGTEDVVFGTAVSGRAPEVPGIEDMVGLFVNTVPVRVRARGGRTFAGIVEEVQARALACEPHHACPLARIQAATPLRERLLAMHVTLENYPIQQVIAENAGPLRVEAAEFFEQTHYDFDMQVLPSADGLRVLTAFSEAAYDAAQIHRIEAHLRAAIAAVLANPDVRLRDIELLGADERRLIVPPEAITAPARAPFETLIEGFVRQVAERPDAVAVTCGDEQLTYGELDRRAGRVASALRARGVGPDVLVPLYFDRSLDLVAAILSVEKAGGAYVPIDLSYPAERIAMMLEDCAAPVVLTHSSRRGEIPAGAHAVLAVDEIGADRDAPVEEGFPRHLSAQNLAYVIYTSGSTGRPKGVMITHENVTRLFAVTGRHFAFGPGDVWTMFHSYAFDFSVWELWGALLYGGRLVVVPFWLSRSPDEFLALLQDEQVTVLNQTPSAFRLLSAADAESDAALALRSVVFGGEALDVEHLRRWFGRHGYTRPQLVNMYGITETTVHVTHRPLDEAVFGFKGSLIGGPIDDLTLHVLDEDCQLVPIGVAGELYVGGAGLARAYLKRPALTAERFVPDGRSGAPGARLYRTGDLARRLEGYEIDYLGRIDHQVQLHGFRIELGEIETALRSYPGIADAHVECREDRPGEPELVAYVITAGETCSTPEVRRALASVLPDYMIPAHIVSLTAFPLTVNGKLDRRALPPPAAPSAAGDREIEMPRTESERALAAVWKDVLRVDRVGVHDNYLALGGDSIKAIQVVSRLRRDGWKLAIRDLFQSPTIAGLAPLLTRAAEDAPARAAVREAPLTAIQVRFLREHLVEPNRFNQAACLHAPGGFDAEAVAAALAAIFEHHDALRLRVTRRGDTWLQTAAAEAPAGVEMIDLPHIAGDSPALIEQHASRLHGSLDLERGPLARVALLRMADGDRLLIVVHHMAIDGVSWRILLEDLSTAYAQAVAKRPVALPRSDSYLAWAAASSEFAGSTALLQELAYWMEVDAHPSARLVPASCSAANRYGDAVAQRLVLDRERTAQLIRAANAAYRTSPEDLLLAALARAVHRCRGALSTLLQLEGHGREEIVEGFDSSRTIGWFTSVYPFALRLPHDRDLGYQIKSIKEDLRAVPRRGAGYGLLRYVTPSLPMGSSLDARPEISFNYLGHFNSDGKAGGEGFQVSLVGGAGGVSAAATRPCELDISALVLGEEGVVEFQFVPSRLPASDVTQLRLAFDEELGLVLDHCTGKRDAELTPADLTFSALSLDELDELFE